MRYMHGRLGGVKIVILPNRDYVEGDPVNSHTHKASASLRSSARAWTHVVGRTEAAQTRITKAASRCWALWLPRRARPLMILMI
jgi:hypothetical protein